VRRADGIPLLLPEGFEDGDASAAILDAIDGLILSGGADLDPASYGADPHPATDPPRPERDRFELALARGAVERDLPLLGICRGMQLLNVALGGDLVQHLPDLENTGVHDPGAGLYQRRDVRMQDGTRLHELLGDSASVACHHHQALGRVAAGLTPTAWAEDGVVEGVEADGHRFCLAVQWHPEESQDNRLFDALVAASG
jgi:gamma-glutamyl-gamma-aminobutyrate hydrolase PuuD